MEITFNKKKFLLHIVNEDNFLQYSQMLTNINICDKKFITKSYETMSYEVLEDEGYYGFFITDLTNHKLYCSCIIDINTNQITNKITEKIKNYSTANSVEITLLCSNKLERIYGLTKYLLNEVITKFIKIYKPQTDKIILSVANKLINPEAVLFYEKFGFKTIKGLDDIMEFDLSSKNNNRFILKLNRHNSRTRSANRKAERSNSRSSNRKAQRSTSRSGNK